jgi:hypothetical protein
LFEDAPPYVWVGTDFSTMVILATLHAKLKPHSVDNVEDLAILPPCLPYLTPFDPFLWTRIKENVYAIEIATI